MRCFVRAAEPAVLQEKGSVYTDAWVALRAKNPAAQFAWPQVGGERVNHLLLPMLKAQTQQHCSFCDGFPVEDVSKETIEHFRSKTSFPLLAFAWANLFYACTACQGDKLSEDSALLLNPDAEDYQFNDYFYWDVESGTLLANPRASAEKQDRAAATIRLYGLNEHNRPTYRKEQRSRWRKLKGLGEDIHRWPYRDFLEDGQT